MFIQRILIVSIIALSTLHLDAMHRLNPFKNLARRTLHNDTAFRVMVWGSLLGTAAACKKASDYNQTRNMRKLLQSNNTTHSGKVSKQ